MANALMGCYEDILYIHWKFADYPGFLQRGHLALSTAVCIFNQFYLLME